jgi:hypothetical protein
MWWYIAGILAIIALLVFKNWYEKGGWKNL